MAARPSNALPRPAQPRHPRRSVPARVLTFKADGLERLARHRVPDADARVTTSGPGARFSGEAAPLERRSRRAPALPAAAQAARSSLRGPRMVARAAGAQASARAPDGGRCALADSFHRLPTSWPPGARRSKTWACARRCATRPVYGPRPVRPNVALEAMSAFGSGTSGPSLSGPFGLGLAPPGRRCAAGEVPRTSPVPAVSASRS
jgi:hypothetical protein